MKYLFINVVAGIGSTGRIAAEKCRELQAQGHECVLAYGRAENGCEGIRTYRIGTSLDYRMHGILTRFFDLHGFGSVEATKRFLKWIREYDPDVIWLHNIHGYYINVELLFDYLRTCGKEIYWTLHDCWAFTGHCSHFMYVGCSQWQTRCEHCPQTHEYPACYGLANVKRNYDRKKRAFTGIPNLKIITPSQWLADNVKKSFLSEYPITVVKNKINTEIFKPTSSDFRKRYGLDDKVILLGVASKWTERKGFEDIVRLPKLLGENYWLVIVGLSQKQIKHLPSNIIGIERTQNATELATIYTAADIFVNMSYEENYPTVNLEAEACGTPVISYDTGGCRETLHDPRSVLVETGNLGKLVEEIRTKGKA